MDCSPWGHKESDMTERLSSDTSSGYSKCSPWSGSISTTWELVRNAGSQLPLWASLVAQLVKNLPAMREPWV